MGGGKSAISARGEGGNEIQMGLRDVGSKKMGDSPEDGSPPERGAHIAGHDGAAEGTDEGCS